MGPAGFFLFGGNRCAHVRSPCFLRSFSCPPRRSPARTGGERGAPRGYVKDADGQPIADAKVELTRESGGGPSTKTDKKGHWAVMGLIGGKWNVDVSAPGL